MQKTNRNLYFSKEYLKEAYSNAENSIEKYNILNDIEQFIKELREKHINSIFLETPHIKK